MSFNTDILLQNWEKRNIQGFYFKERAAALDKILGMIPVSAAIGLSGSQTIDRLEIVKQLEIRGNFVFNPYKPGLSRQESMEIRNKGAGADYFLTSANAISQSGELVFFSAYGHRISGIANAKNVIVVCGINKVVSDIGQALKRSREHATVLNCKRLEWNTPCFKFDKCDQEICLFPEYKRMCCQVLIIEAEPAPQRLRVVLIAEDLGF